MRRTDSFPLVAIACGGTGGHMFPGIAVGEELLRRQCRVLLLISPKDVDQRSVSSAAGMATAVLPAVGWVSGQRRAFFAGFWRSYKTACRVFQEQRPRAVLAMGGFTAAPPILAGKRSGASTFLHESNTIPGRANRFLAHVVDQCFVGFSEATGRLHHTRIITTGTPVRPQFQSVDPAACRMAIGCDPERPLLLIMGGSQGASGINRLAVEALPHLAATLPKLQFLHLTGVHDFEKIEKAYRDHRLTARVLPFLTEMELAMGAATLTVSRAGASSLAELATVRLPAILIPYPAAADAHQFHNARAYEESGAARLLDQATATGESLAKLVADLIRNPGELDRMASALGQWHAPDAAGQIAEKIVQFIAVRYRGLFESSPRKETWTAPTSSPRKSSFTVSPPIGGVR